MEKMLDADLIGIGRLLKQTRFSVPPHQRAYAWQDDQINDLYRDLNDALKRNKEEYFLGTAVLARGGDSRMSIIDGQQRLVTTSVLIAAIRDYFDTIGQDSRAREIEREYLAKRDIRSMEESAHLHLIPEDRDFFVRRVVRPPSHTDREAQPSSPSQQRLSRAIEIAASFIEGLTRTTQAPDDALLDLLGFLDDQAKLISVAVGDEANAFVIFEVLNDRGLDLSVSDLLKNYVFRLAGDRLTEAQEAWQRMSVTIADGTDGPEIKAFIRHAWIAKNGLVREKNLYESIKRQVTTKARAIEFVKSLGADAQVYNALRAPSDERWKGYGDRVVEALEVIELVGVTQIRPLLMAIFGHFKTEEIKRTLPMVVAWTVRFLICGSGGSGTLETYYSERAKEVSSGSIKTASDLFRAMATTIPDDKTFEDAFASATVSKSHLAKYYLRVLDRFRNAGDDDLVVNPDGDKVNLEHILPQTPSDKWPHIPSDQHPALVKRIGNLTLLNKRLNVKAANGSFTEKQRIFSGSKISLTNDLKHYTQWTGAEIEARQRELAQLAVRAWPAKPQA